MIDDDFDFKASRSASKRRSVFMRCWAHTAGVLSLLCAVGGLVGTVLAAFGVVAYAFLRAFVLLRQYT